MTPHAEKVSMFTRHISVTRLHESTLIIRCTHSGYSIDVKTKNKYINFVTKILRKTCSSLVKIISEGENNFTQTNYDKLPKISAKNKCVFLQKNKCKGANMGSSIEFNSWCRPDRYSNLFLYYIKRM